MTTCAVKEYLEGESVWREALVKQKGKENWLEEITDKKEDSDGEDEEVKTKKRKKDKKEKKRKRKRSVE